MPEVNLSAMDATMKKAIQDMAFGEGASSDNDTVSMIVHSALSRYLSGRKEFGGPSIADVVKKGYYAVSNPNTPYKQATSGKFPDIKSKARYAEIGKLVDAITGDKSYSKDKPQFYFTDKEIERLTKSKGFDFSKVKAKGIQGKYKLYGY